MAKRVIHFGPDDCHRRMVLQSAGYSVDDCQSLTELRSRLLTGTAFEAVLMSEVDGIAPEDVAAIARMHGCGPVVLFRGTSLSHPESEFDLVIHALTPPEVWLAEVEALIESEQAEHTDSEVLAGRSGEFSREDKIAGAR